jgi:hypothetical protein
MVCQTLISGAVMLCRALRRQVCHIVKFNKVAEM